MKIKGKHIFALILVLIGIAFTIYVTVPAYHNPVPVETKTVKDTIAPQKGAANGQNN